MRPPQVSAIVSLAFAILVSASSPLRTTTIYALPLEPPFPDPPAVASPSSFKPLAQLSYSPIPPHKARLDSFTPPPNSTSLTSIAVFDPHSSPSSGGDNYRSIATATYGFYPPFKGRFRLVLSANRETVLSADWVTWLPPQENESKKNNGRKGNGNGNGKGGNGAGEDRGDFDVVIQSIAPSPVLDQPVKGQKVAGGQGVDGQEGEEVQEKTFLQKYWWLLLAVLVITVMGPGGDK